MTAADAEASRSAEAIEPYATEGAGRPRERGRRTAADDAAGGTPRRVERKRGGRPRGERERRRSVEATGETVGEAKWAALRSSSSSSRASTARASSSRSSPRASEASSEWPSPAHVIATARAPAQEAPRPRARPARCPRVRRADRLGDRRERDDAGSSGAARSYVTCSGRISGSSSASTARRSTRSSTSRTRWRARRAVARGHRRRSRLPSAADGDARGRRPALGATRRGYRARRRPRADDRRRAQDRPRGAEGRPRGRDRERGLGAEPLRRRPPAARRGLSGRRLLERWLEEVLATPGLTASDDAARARSALLEDALRAAPLVSRAAARSSTSVGRAGLPASRWRCLPDLRSRSRGGARKCDFLSASTAEGPNVDVVWGEPRSSRRTRSGSRSRRRSRSRRSRPSSAFHSWGPRRVPILWLGGIPRRPRTEPSPLRGRQGFKPQAPPPPSAEALAARLESVTADPLTRFHLIKLRRAHPTLHTLELHSSLGLVLLEEDLIPRCVAGFSLRSRVALARKQAATVTLAYGPDGSSVRWCAGVGSRRTRVLYSLAECRLRCLPGRTDPVRGSPGLPPLCEPARGSTRWRIRRAGSARRRPPSTRGVPRRGGRARAADRPRSAGERQSGSACAPTEPQRTTCSTARPPHAREAVERREPRRRNGEERPCGRAVDLAIATAASAISRTRSTARVVEYSYVLLDCSPSFGPLTVNALAAANRAIVPVQAEYYALEGLSQLLGTINLVKAQLNPQLAVAGILLTMADGARGSRPRSRPSCVGTSARWCSRRRFLARCASPRRRATVSLRLPTTAARPAPRPTGRWRWSLSSVPKERRGLGRGLEVLLGEAGQPELVHLPVETIHPNPRQPAAGSSPRRRPVSRARSGLQGVLQPIVVRRRAEGGFELIAGERRWRGARGRDGDLPAVVRDVEDRDSLLLGLVENVAREQLSPSRKRGPTRRSSTSSSSLGDVADRVGRSKPSVSNRLRLLELPEEVLWMLARGDMSEGQCPGGPLLPRRRRAEAARAAHRQGGAHRPCGRAGGA